MNDPLPLGAPREQGRAGTRDERAQNRDRRRY